MPISITTDLTDVNLSDATTNYAVLGTWATAIAVSADTYVQSGNVVGGRVSASTGWAHTTIPTTTVDLTTSERHVFQWLKSITIPQLDSKANGGLGITISSDATPTLTGTTPSNGPTNSKTWYVGGYTDALSGWVCYVVDPQSTPSLTLGSPAVNSIRRIGVRGKVVGTVGAGAVRPVNVLFDATRYGTGLTYQGDNSGTPGTFEDILSIAMDPTYAWGVLTADSSIYFGSGKMDFGTIVQSSVSSFKDIGQTFVWRNFPVATTFYTWRIRGTSSYNTTFQLGNYTSGLASDGLVIKGAGDPSSSTHAVWTLDVGTNTICNIYGSQLSELYRTTLQSTSSVRGCVFKNFGNITANGATIDSCTFQDLRITAPISATYGIEAVTTAPILTNNTFINCATAVKWDVNSDTSGKLDGCTFTSGGTGHAIELGTNTPSSISLSNITFTGYGADGTTNAAIYNNSNKSITINVSGGTTPTIRNGTGASTSLPTTCTLTMTVKDESGNPVVGAYAYIDDNNQTPFILNSTTNSSGIVTVAYSGDAVPSATWRVRKYGYKDFELILGISGSDIDLPVTLIEDPLQI
jgi:hypothetical protein